MLLSKKCFHVPVLEYNIQGKYILGTYSHNLSYKVSWYTALTVYGLNCLP